ncbi:hypothetical protein WJX74_006529 [Apatococcus lobatus]|uniref:Tryptophan synthase beta chain-like PALP domain-containing protein n=1 Tax=Apatococcus lobatus TaxID=904363 RepID=A0AAW1Q5Z3_9CHLO
MNFRALLGSPSVPSALLIHHRSARKFHTRLVLRCGIGQPTESAQSTEKHFLERGWLFSTPAVKVEQLQASISGQPESEILVIRDDLLHPLIGGNKVRKLDGMLPSLKEAGVTHVVTCGGLQSSHTAAVACACAENGMHAHLVIRGEQPSIPTGYHLYARLFGTVEYATRADYSNRQKVLQDCAQRLQDSLPSSAKVHIIPEGAANADALLGFVRLVDYLSQPSVLGRSPCNLVIDSGTGITATGLGLGIKLLQLPWSVTAVSLVEKPEQCRIVQGWLTSAFAHQHLGGLHEDLKELPIEWVPRIEPRRFGKVLPGEIGACRQVAQQCGILVDPIYNLSAWTAALHRASQTDDQLESLEEAEEVTEAHLMSATSFRVGAAIEPMPYSQSSMQPPGAALGLHKTADQSMHKTDQPSQAHSNGNQEGCSLDGMPAVASLQDGKQPRARIAVLHTGGSLGLCGLAQRFPGEF